MKIQVTNDMLLWWPRLYFSPFMKLGKQMWVSTVWLEKRVIFWLFRWHVKWHATYIPTAAKAVL